MTFRAVDVISTDNQIKISAASLRLEFDGCEPTFVRDVCHGRCCLPGTKARPLTIPVLPAETVRLRKRGATVSHGLVKPVNNRCPFQEEDGLCGLHFTGDKPWGCWASPFKLNKHRTLVVMNWMKFLICFKNGQKLPAYKAFRSSLDHVLGEETADHVCRHLDAGGGDLYVTLPKEKFDNFMRTHTGIVKSVEKAKETK